MLTSFLVRGQLSSPPSQFFKIDLRNSNFHYFVDTSNCIDALDSYRSSRLRAMEPELYMQALLGRARGRSPGVKGYE